MEINGHWLHVREYGPVHGPTVVLLHHGLGTTRAWRRQAPALAAAGLHTLVYDRWGYGQSTPRLGLGMPDFKEDQADLLAILYTKGITQAALVGHSDGGTIALQFSADHPGRVWALVTIAAHI